MINFGDYAVLGEVTHVFKKAPGWWWKIKPITSGAELEMARFLYRNREVYDEKGNMMRVPPLNLEIAHREIALLFGGTNIPQDVDQPIEYGGAPYIPDGATLEQIETALRAMPRDMVMEIWTAISDANPTANWGPDLPKEESDPKS